MLQAKLDLLNRCVNNLEEQIKNIESGILDDVLDKVVNYYVPNDYAEICEGCKFPPKPILTLDQATLGTMQQNINNPDYQPSFPTNFMVTNSSDNSNQQYYRYQYQSQSAMGVSFPTQQVPMEIEAPLAPQQTGPLQMSAASIADNFKQTTTSMSNKPFSQEFVYLPGDQSNPNSTHIATPASSSSTLPTSSTSSATITAISIIEESTDDIIAEVPAVKINESKGLPETTKEQFQDFKAQTHGTRAQATKAKVQDSKSKVDELQESRLQAQDAQASPETGEQSLNYTEISEGNRRISTRGRKPPHLIMSPVGSEPPPPPPLCSSPPRSGKAKNATSPSFSSAKSVSVLALPPVAMEIESSKNEPRRSKRTKAD